jgi:nucleotide-binding universal stress UspA family protein
MKLWFFDASTVAHDMLSTTVRNMHWREVAVKKIEKILVPTDLSESSLAGVGYALNLAKTLGAEVTVLHVLSYEDFLRYGEKLREQIVNDPTFQTPDPYLKEYELALKRFLGERFADLIPSIRVREQVEVGDLDEEIVSEASKQKTDLIVLSARKRTGIARFLKGNVTEKVTRKAPCPVLSIRLEQNHEKRRAA